MKYENDPYEVEYALIQDVEVVREGTWNWSVYGEEFLNEIALTYDPAMLRAKVAKDHEYYGPAFGHVLALRVEDDVSAEGSFKLVATVGFLETGKAMIESGEYNERSIGWASFHPTPGFPYLWEFSLLGVNTPAAVGMEPIIFKEEDAEKMTQQLEIDRVNDGQTQEAIMNQLAWEKTEEYIKHQLRQPSRFKDETIRTIELDEDEGIMAVVGKLKPEYVPEGGKVASMVMQNVMFNLKKGWTLAKAKAWIGERNLAAIDVTISSVVAFQDIPIAEDGSTTNENAESLLAPFEAEARRRIYAGDEDGDNIDWDKYRNCYLWYDSDNKEKHESYKLPIADVIDGELKVIPKAIHAAAEALDKTGNEIEVGLVVQAKVGGPRMTVSEIMDGDVVGCTWFEGNDLKEDTLDIKALNVDVAMIPEVDIPGVKSHLEKYYTKMGKESPWKEEASGDANKVAPDLAIIKSNEGGKAMPEKVATEDKTDNPIVVKEVGSTEDLSKENIELRELKEKRETEAQETLRRENVELREKAETARCESVNSLVRTMYAEGYITGAQVEMGLADALAVIPDDVLITVGDKQRNPVDIITDALRFGGKLKLKLEIAKDILSEDPGDPLIKARAHGIDTSVEERRLQLMKDDPKMSHADALDKATRQVRK